MFITVSWILLASAVNSSDLIYDASCKVKEFGLNREPKTDKINSSKMTARPEFVPVSFR